MNPKVDQYLLDGCGRCKLGGTPQCKVRKWPEELDELRRIVLECGLDEELKWGVPCYISQNRNILIVSALKEYCSLAFFKGVLLKDEEGILSAPGENSQSTRLIRFTNVSQILELEPILKTYIREAIEIEKNGLKPDLKTTLEYPEELVQVFDEYPALETAFKALTPGRQRAYILYFSAPKQLKTRLSRIEKYMQQIMNGKGMFD